MKETRVKKAVAVLAAIAALVAATTALADEKMRVGIVDVRKVLVESKIGKQNHAELEKMVKERRDKLGKEETAIKAMVEKFEKDKLVLNDKQKEQKQKEIQDKVDALKKMSQDAQEEVRKRDAELSSKAGAVLREVLNSIARQEKVAFVIDKNQSSIVWVEEEVDITEKVSKAYEAKTGK
jgi:outer membrane protein